MTREKFTQQLPKITDGELSMKPPFVFDGLSARVFPMRASLQTLQELVNCYLNFIPPEVGYFRVTLPYVYLAVLDYGRMSEEVMRDGWFSQTEVFFSIALEWYKLVQGRYVFHDWGVITPYIFVNDDISMPVGRSVFGFPKILATVMRTDSRWMKDPLAPTTLARIETAVFPKAYSGDVIENRVFLEIQQDGVSNFRTPFDSRSPMMPWSIASNLAAALAGFSRDATWMAQALRIFPLNPFVDPALFQELMSRIPPILAPWGAGFIQNSLNLKQFRRASSPSQICYQALTNGGMQTTGFNGGGLLGEERILFGDLSGGHTIRLYEQSSLPIARILGLEAHSSSKDENGGVAEFKPVLPFWMDVNIQYNPGSTLVWRTDNGIWKDETGAPLDPEQKPVGEKDGPLFNSAVTTATEAIAGPFQFTGTTIRVIPLLAEKEALQTYLDCFLNDALSSPIVGADGVTKEQFEFEVWARPPQAIDTGTPVGGDLAYVYLTATSFTGVASKTDNVGNWAQYELAFMIPVKWKRRTEDGSWAVIAVGLVPAFTFVDSCIAAISRLEVQGIPAMAAEFVRPESVWLSEEGQIDPEQTFLRVDAEVFSAMGKGQKATMQPLVEISVDDLDAGLGDTPDRAWKWSADLRLELATKKAAKQQHFADLKVARALALELLGNQAPACLYTMKQFRDVTDPDRACYQALVRVPRVLAEVFDVREIEETLVVRIHDYPSLNIVEALGIQATSLEDNSSGILYAAQGIRPFYIRATVDEPLAERIVSRAGNEPWTLHPGAFSTMLSEKPEAPRITVDLLAETLQDEVDPSRSAATMFQALKRQQTGSVPATDRITVSMARQAFEVVDPQIVIESVLSREWSNYDPNARWRQGKQKLVEAFNSLPERGAIKSFAESAYFLYLNNLMAVAPGAVAGVIPQQDALITMMQDVVNEQMGPSPQTVKPPSTGPGDDLIRRISANLSGEGAAVRWREAVGAIVKNQAEFSNVHIKLEEAVDVLSEVAILGLDGFNQAYDLINKAIIAMTFNKSIVENPDPLSPIATPQPQTLPVPGVDELEKDAATLGASLKAIFAMSIVGQPSPEYNLDPRILADHARLGELLAGLRKALDMEAKMNPRPEAVLITMAQKYGDQLMSVVDLARRYCDVQYQALLNKLSRGYQKPDFCIRRDAVGSSANSDSLLPMTLSWDQHWYYGEQIVLNPDLASTVLERISAVAPPQPAAPVQSGGE